MTETNSEQLAFLPGNSGEVCEQHHLELNSFCEVDEKVVCAACECQLHSPVPIAEAAKRYRDKLRLHRDRLLKEMHYISKKQHRVKNLGDFEIRGNDDQRRIIRKNSKENETRKQIILSKLAGEYNRLKTVVAELHMMLTKNPVQLLKNVKRVKQMLEEVKIKAPEDISSNLNDPTSEETGYSLEEERRIVLVGKTGVGKSATGNTILGEGRFKSERRATSVTNECQKEGVPEKKITVVDTPGLLGTHTSENDTLEAIAACCVLCPEGFHAIVLVLSVTARFTDEEKEAVQRVKDIFGPGAEKYTMVVFTSEDQLENQTIQDYVEKSEQLRQLVAGCGDRFCAFDNKKTGLESRQQVDQLFTIIDEMVEENGGSCYTNEMFQAVGKIVHEAKICRQNGLRFRGTHRATTHTDAHKTKPEIDQEEIKREAENDVIDLVKLLRIGCCVAGGLIGAVVGGMREGIAGAATGAAKGASIGESVGAFLAPTIYEIVKWIFKQIKKICKVRQFDNIGDVAKYFSTN